MRASRVPVVASGCQWLQRRQPRSGVEPGCTTLRAHELPRQRSARGGACMGFGADARASAVDTIACVLGVNGGRLPRRSHAAPAAGAVPRRVRHSSDSGTASTATRWSGWTPAHVWGAVSHATSPTSALTQRERVYRLLALRPCRAASCARYSTRYGVQSCKRKSEGGTFAPVPSAQWSRVVKHIHPGSVFCSERATGRIRESQFSAMRRLVQCALRPTCPAFQ